MRQCQPPEYGAAGRRQAHPYLAAVLLPGMALDGARLLQPVDQFDGAVVLDKQSARDLASGRIHSVRQPLNGEQQLVLLRLDSVLGCGGFAEVKEAANLAAEFRQIAILLG